MGIITETFVSSSDNTDVLKAPSRLNSIPEYGTLILEFSANTHDGSNAVAHSIQLPDGSEPVDDQEIPANGFDNARDILHNESEVMYQFEGIEEGAHVLVAIDVKGSARWIMRATLIF